MITTDQITVTSAAFAEGAAIPDRYTCDGDDVSPPLSWSGAPTETEAYLVIVDDPDAGGFVHWVASDIPGNVNELPDGASGDQAGTEGENDSGGVGWSGPCPPSGTHRYIFTVYALSGRLELSGAFDAATARRAMAGKALAQGRLIGTYRRSE